MIVSFIKIPYLKFHIFTDKILSVLLYTKWTGNRYIMEQIIKMSQNTRLSS